MATRTVSRFEVRHHQLPRSHFDALCVGLGGADVVRELWRTQRSRRLLLINEVADAGKSDSQLFGPLPPVELAWHALLASEGSMPDQVGALLLHPQIGSWAAYTLRRHRGGATNDAPMWVDFGMLHSVALVAAARAGLTWRTCVPARAGHVMLPGLGMATFTDGRPWSFVEAETRAGNIVLRGADREIVVPPHARADIADWLPLRRIRVGTEPVLAVSLDDLDPFRDLADPVPPQRLDDATFARWERYLGEAWTLLCREHRETAEAMAEGVVSFVPLSGGDGWETRSASTGDAFGSVLCSSPSDSLTLAVAMVHEFQHIKLGGLMQLGRLTEDDDVLLWYAPWRDDPRPLTGLLQGLYAFVGIAAFWREHRRIASGVDGRIADFEYAYARAQVCDALGTAAGSGSLSDWGAQLVARLSERINAWQVDPLPVEALGAAELVADNHRAGWRIRNLQAPATYVDGLARMWSSGKSDGLGHYVPSVVPHEQTRWSHGMLGYLRQRIAAPGAPLTSALRARGLDEADDALLGDHFEDARHGYQNRLRVDPDDLGAWVGLGLTASGGARATLLSRPELVRAVYARIAANGAAPDPVALAGWLSRTMNQAPPI